MSTANTNQETGIRYGIIAANNLESWVIDEIQMDGRDVHWDDWVEEVKRDTRAEWEAGILECEDETELEDTIEDRIVNGADNYQDDEPVHEFEIDGVKGRTTWLGGALLVWVFESPHTTYAKLCSPCVPNCGDLDSEVDSCGSELCYDVPAEWRRKEEA